MLAAGGWVERFAAEALVLEAGGALAALDVGLFVVLFEGVAPDVGGAVLEEDVGWVGVVEFAACCTGRGWSAFGLLSVG